MNEFSQSFSPILKRTKKYLIEIILISLALIIAFISLFLYLKNNQAADEVVVSTSNFSTALTTPTKIYLDIAGAVNKPGVYQLNLGSRLKDAIKIAGNLSDDADKDFFARNFNLARIVSDQEKIYVPSVWEVQNGYFAESQQILNYLSPTNNSSLLTANSSLININSATLDELDTLPGIGQVTAQKIIENRPYQSIDELLNKKVVNKSVFKKIKDLIKI
jgi:competence protein ComEA